MTIIDSRALREPYPTGVSEVAKQFIKQLERIIPDAVRFSGEKNFSNSLTNFSLMCGLTTLEQQSGVHTKRALCFLPNTHFINTRSTAVRIQVVHDLSFFHSPQWYSPRVRAWHRATNARHEIAVADIIIAVSEFTKRDLVQHLKIPAEIIHVVHPTTPIAIGGSHPKLPFKNKPFFLFLGTLEKRKNVRGVIEAFEIIKNKPELKDFQLVLAGRAGFGAPKKSELPDRVHHISYITPEEKWWLLKHACALVYPSFFEGFGLPPLEAASVGCPTIVSDCTALPETMGDASIFVSPYDVTQVALAMEAVATDKKLVAGLRERGFRRAAWYSLDKQRAALQSAVSHAQTYL